MQAHCSPQLPKATSRDCLLAPGPRRQAGEGVTVCSTRLCRLQPRQPAAWIFGLQQNGETRSNLALVNTGEVDSNPITFNIELFDGSTGTKVSTIEGVSLKAKGWTQLVTLLGQHAPGVTQGYARVTRVAGSNPFIAYAVINDGGQPGERTGDGAFVASSP